MPRHPRPITAAAVAILAALMSGCYSEAPLDAVPKIDVDTRLLGAWNCASADPGTPEASVATFAVSPDRKREYHLTWQEREQKPERYRAFISSLRDVAFLNVQPLDRNERPAWAFVRYSFLREDVLYVEVASQKLYEDKAAGATPAAARATLLGALKKQKDAIQTFCVCLRPTPDTP